MAEAGVAHRTIGQQGFVLQRERPRSTLDEIAALIEWEPIATLLGRLYPASNGEPAWPPLEMLTAILLVLWYDLSDVKLADALETGVIGSAQCFKARLLEHFHDER